MVLVGPDSATLVDPIATETLRAEILYALTHWGKVILDNPTEYSSRFYQSYIVLNWRRKLHDLHRGHPGSRREGGEWARKTLGERWGG